MPVPSEKPRMVIGIPKLEGRDCVGLALKPVDKTGAAAVARVIEDQRGDAVLGEDALNGEPLRDDFADAVADEEC